MKTLLAPRPFLFCLATALLAAGCGREAEFGTLAGWGADLAAAQREAKVSGKPLAILYSAAWSAKARDFEQRVLSDPVVRDQLKRFVCVRLNLDDQKSPKGGVSGVPALVLVSPQGEEQVLHGAVQAAADLAGFLKTLGEWKPLEGWASDPDAAAKQAEQSGKPLAVLYSAAWEPAARVFEAGALSDAAVKKELARFTLLRLNLSAHQKRATDDDKVASAPALVFTLPGSDKKTVVPGKCSAELLAGFIANLGKYPEMPGWRTDYDQAMQEARSAGKPVVLLFDSGSHWASWRFAKQTLANAKLQELLRSCVRVRLEHARHPELVRKWTAGESPSLVIVNPEGSRLFKDYNLQSAVKDLTDDLRAVIEKAEQQKKPEGRAASGARAPEEAQERAEN